MCDNLVYAGFDDWYLPTRGEYERFWVDACKSGNWCGAVGSWDNTMGAMIFWASQTCVNTYQYGCILKYNGIGYYQKDDNAGVRCIRSNE